VQCWKQAGRALYFVDAQTGVLIKKIYDNGTIFPSPLVGTPTAYLDTVGSIATEGFVLDADGVLWRIDLTATDPKKDSALEGWTVRPFHDLFWDRGAAEGETTYERPILSLDEYHRVVVLVGTGDTDHFDKIKAQNRVVSLTELSDTTPILPSHYRAALNWEHIVVPNDKNSMAVSELVTGTMALFQGQLFVPSFISAPVTSDACEMGRGRLWSFDYHGRDTTRANPLVSGAPTTTYGPKRIKVTYGGTTVDNTDTGLFNVSVDVAEKNLLVLGLGTTQRPACGLADSALTANYFTPTLPGIHKPAQPPALWIVGQASGDKASRKRAGSQLSSLEVEVGRNQAFSQLASWAGSVE
jgi:hypothetical protein